MLRTRPPLYFGPKPFLPDLHVLSLPLTFALSQDQTLQLRCLNPLSNQRFDRVLVCIFSLLLAIQFSRTKLFQRAKRTNKQLPNFRFLAAVGLSEPPSEKLSTPGIRKGSTSFFQKTTHRRKKRSHAAISAGLVGGLVRAFRPADPAISISLIARSGTGGAVNPPIWQRFIVGGFGHGRALIAASLVPGGTPSPKRTAVPRTAWVGDQAVTAARNRYRRSAGNFGPSASRQVPRAPPENWGRDPQRCHRVSSSQLWRSDGSRLCTGVCREDLAVSGSQLRLADRLNLLFCGAPCRSRSHRAVRSPDRDQAKSPADRHPTSFPRCRFRQAFPAFGRCPFLVWAN